MITITLYETNNIIFRKNYLKLGKMNVRFWKNISNKGKISLNSFRNFVYVSSVLDLGFVWKRLFNIFKTTNVTKLTTVFLKSSYRVLKESPYLNSCMIFKEKYFSGDILLTDQISLSGFFYSVKYWDHVVTS